MSTAPFYRIVASGRFNPPWLAELPKTRERLYDLAYKTTATALFAGSVYGLVEVTRGCYYILKANHGASTSPVRAFAKLLASRHIRVLTV